jgi:hypothetical protein
VIPVTEMEATVRAVSHGLANRLLAIRCYAELATRAADRGTDPRGDLAGLLSETETLTTLVRELAKTANAAARGGPAEALALARFVGDCFPGELVLALDLERTGS